MKTKVDDLVYTFNFHRLHFKDFHSIEYVVLLNKCLVFSSFRYLISTKEPLDWLKADVYNLLDILFLL